MAVFNASDIEADILADLYSEYTEHKDVAEQMILDLEVEPANKDNLNQLFRAIHTIKGNMGLIGLHPPVSMLHSLEDLLHLIRTGELSFQPLVGDITLLLLDRCGLFLESCMSDSRVEYDEPVYQAVSNYIKQVMVSKAESQQAALESALKLLDPTISVELTKPISVSPEDLVGQIINRDPDLAFLYATAINSQYRCQFWEGRLQRVLALGLNLNRQLGAPVNPNQLVAAFCAHDLAMAFLPSELLNKSTPLADSEYAIMRHHVSMGADLLSYYPSLNAAQEIILHHHEFWDGTGYPMGFSMADIHVGARIMSMVHAFEAITHGLSRDTKLRRPLMRAVMELNRHSGTQFDPELVAAFMEVTRIQS